MADITAELDALPPFSNPVAYRDTWQAGCELLSQDVAAYRTRLALAERRLKEYEAAIAGQWELLPMCSRNKPGSYARGRDTGMADTLRALAKPRDDARAYLAFRAKERP